MIPGMRTGKGSSRMAKLKVRLASPWDACVHTERAILNREFSVAEADALLSIWSPCDELLAFPRRKAWYCCEPSCQFRVIEGGRWATLRARLDRSEFLHHAHPEARFRVPHVTHFEPLSMNVAGNRRARAIAIVSNHGGSPLTRHRDLSFRNHMVTGDGVDLFGRAGWASYRASAWSRRRAPANYQGELPGDWSDTAKRSVMSTYKVCVCLENMNEFGYFSEKFVEAVVAGCIPVYRASADIRDTVLQGARWFDPADARWPGRAAIAAALDANLADVQQANLEWLQNSASLAATHSHSVFEKLVDALFPDA